MSVTASEGLPSLTALYCVAFVDKERNSDLRQTKPCTHVKLYNYVYILLLWCFPLQEYIHRVGRTARGEGGRGHALLILRPEELGFLRYLKQAKVPLNEFEFSWNKISNIQPQVGTSQPPSTAPPPPQGVYL